MGNRKSGTPARRVAKRSRSASPEADAAKRRRELDDLVRGTLAYMEEPKEDDTDAMLKLGIYVAVSGIPRAGLGAFTLRPIRKGTVLGEYAGRPVPADATGDYVMALPGMPFAVDASDVARSFWTRFINSGNYDGVPVAPNNVEYVPAVVDEELGGGRRRRYLTVQVRASADVPARAELLVDYGGFRVGA